MSVEMDEMRRKAALYDTARAEVKTDGNTRAFYVLQRDAAFEREEQLREALAKIAARGGDTPPYSQMALDMWMIARAALESVCPSREKTRQ